MEDNLMNAIDFLIKEHHKVRTLLADLNDPSHKKETKIHLFETIKNELIRHEEMEQTVWYPKLSSNKELLEEIKHLLHEEKDASKLIDHLTKIMNSSEWEEELIKLQKDVEHHAKEEEKELFPKVKKFLDETELTRIGEAMREFKENYKS